MQADHAGYQAGKLSSCQAVKLSSCQAVKLSRWQAGKPSGWQAGKPSGWQAGKVASCQAGKPVSWQANKPAGRLVGTNTERQASQLATGNGKQAGKQIDKKSQRGRLREEENN